MRRVLVALVVVAAALVPAVGSAQTTGDGVLLILDASGSMNQETGDGSRLIDAAKDALREIVLRLPSDAQVGLRVYGHRAGNDDPVAGCVDTELIVPVGPIDRDLMIGAIDGFDASGFTPIGLSLQEAAEDLGGGGGTIILVSDGVDTCAPPDPCEVAAELAQQGFVTRIHTVGLLLEDPAAEDQLRCIAGAAGGTFTDIASVDQILEGLSGIVTGAVEGPHIENPFIEGALERDLAQTLTWRPTGYTWWESYAESTIDTGETRWWAVDVDDTPSQMAVNASIDWQSDASPDEYIEVQIFDENGVEIGEPNEVLGIIVSNPQRLFLRDAGDFAFAPNDPPTATAATDPRSMFPSWEPSEDWFQPTVRRFADAGLNGGMYHMWKGAEYNGSLEPGRYYIALSWESDRQDTSPVLLSATRYGTDRGPAWPDNRPAAAVRVIDDSLDGVGGALELEPGGDEAGVLSDLGSADRSVEVWVPIVSEDPLEYTVDLADGEVMFVGVDTVAGLPEGDPPDVRYRLVDPDGFGGAGLPEFEGGFGFGHSEAYEARVAGEHRISLDVGVDPARESAVAVSVFVFPPMSGSSDVGSVDEGAAAQDTRLRESAVDAVLAGLAAVREAVGEA